MREREEEYTRANYKGATFDPFSKDDRWEGIYIYIYRMKKHINPRNMSMFLHKQWAQAEGTDVVPAATNPMFCYALSPGR